MDPQAYATTHQDEWERLAILSRKRSLNGAEIDELIHLYQNVTGQLAHIRRQAPDPDLILTLSRTLGSARARLTQRKKGFGKTLVHFFGATLPASFYRLRWWSLAIIVACIALCVLVFAVYTLTPGLIDTLGSARTQEQYATRAFEAYYSEYSHSDFSAMVWTNNAWISLQCVAGGVTGIWPLYVLGQNSIALGQSASIMNRYDRLDLFFQLIAPHGLLELTAIFIAGAAGLKLCWAWIRPGKRTRIEALGEEGLHTVTTGIGLVFALFASGLIEGFVTPSQLPWGIKIIIGCLAFAVFWAWVIVFGRRAVREGTDSHSLSSSHVIYA